MRRVVLTFGLLAGAVLSAMMLLALPFQQQIGFDKAEYVGYTTMVVAFLMIYFGVRSYRENVAGGTIGFWRAVQVGLLITVIATVCYVITWQIIYYQLTPDFGDRYAAYLVEKARASGASEAAIAAKVAEMAKFQEAYRNPLVNVAYTFIEPLPVALTFTLLTAIVQSRAGRVPSPSTDPSRSAA